MRVLLLTSLSRIFHALHSLFILDTSLHLITTVLCTSASDSTALKRNENRTETEKEKIRKRKKKKKRKMSGRKLISVLDSSLGALAYDLSEIVLPL